MNRIILFCVLLFSCLSAGGAAEAEIVKVVYERKPYENGKSFGTIGPYERITGTAFGEVHPEDPRNSMIVDIDKAPRNSRGRVEYEAQFVVIRPVDATKANGALIHTVPNRGNEGRIDAFRLRQGFTLSWVAWQGDILPGNNRLLMKVPIATDNSKPITGRIRTEYIVEEPGIYTVPLGGGPYTTGSHDGYEPVSTDTDTGKATLTMREHEPDERIPVPPSEWSFAYCPQGGTTSGQAGATVEPIKHLCIPAGLERAWIYELIYEAKDPKVMGLGLASTRDALSFFRFNAADSEDNPNPLFSDGKPLLDRVIMTGASQTGRYCREFLYLGFHVDEHDRPLVEGLWPHITAARLPINVRFTAPGRAYLQREEHLFPSYEFPVAYNVMKDAFSERVDGVLERCVESGTCPKILHTVGGAEYWQSLASLDTTDALGKKDLELPANVRFYHLSSTQHGPALQAAKDPKFKNLSNPAPHAESMRALLVALDAWIREDTPPPPSMYPRLSDGTLVMPDQKSTGFPNIPGVAYPGGMNELPRLDYGPEYLTKGIITNHPPKRVPGKSWRPLVPKVDADGNDIAGLRSVTIRVPIGTYTGWNLRSQEAGAEDALYRETGSFIPFEKTKADRLAKGDPRLSLEERYGSHAGYVTKVKEAVERFSERLLLPEDGERIIREAEASDILK